MKKAFLLGLTVLLVIALSTHAFAAGQDIKVTIDGKELVFAAGEAKPIQKDGRVLVPMRKIFQELDFTVMYMDEIKTIRVYDIFGDLPIYFEMVLGSHDVRVRDSYSYYLETPSVIINGTTYVPLRFVAETAYMNVAWHADTKTVEITRQDIKGLDSFVSENIPQTVTIGDKRIEISIYNDDTDDYGDDGSFDISGDPDPYPEIYLYIEDKSDIDYLYNGDLTREEMSEISKVFGQLTYECGEYYHSNAKIQIKSHLYKRYLDAWGQFYCHKLITFEYNIEDGSTVSTWFSYD